MKIAIIGGGIGGLTTALALQRSNLDVTIYESAPEIKPVGAGIIMANNAMQVFDKLGIRQKIEQAGHKISTIKITDPQLKTLSEVQLNKFERKYGVHNIAIHRGDLQMILAEKIGFENIKLSKRLSKIEPENCGYRLNFEDGTIVNAEAVIGADGIKSVVRHQILNIGKLRSSQQKCWRGVSEFDWTTKYNHQAYEAWGKGKRFGFVRINDKKVYWYAVVNENLVKNPNKLEELFTEFNPEVARMISETPKETIFVSDIIDLEPIFQWQKDRVCLIGDAAHATTPNMGQGACQAIEDAYLLGKLFSEGKSVNEVFTHYEKLRMEKAHYIVNTSSTIGKVSHYENSLAIWLRNTLLKATPSSINETQLEKVFDISY
ncbi:FAD-dependent monooxygenase [Chryseobacterium geocarposphaerae]|uniref:2-polyprenyl-6-methoxyphenol hydroxylase-like FAD-dependent oxidoreductase n=1 Tax=Chryseobacterium geocarposphaerae TaxID=1416776 RepID=A0A2M9CBL5_9FLAO|nr:FAD-dependent monooxygenase [Chryseobacterium geocarposphaerae]PJJ68238.1 2-polyprenyl-6-methoxyphenol hydroxylase-like FAD-dependent oxidoreductase [Chryseobacterium geocarposphaerae]